jgi:hypothetical protein
VGNLHITGVFGAICRHEIPLKFLNMFHGERYACLTSGCMSNFPFPNAARLGYPALLMESVLKEYPRAKKCLMSYDIACRFELYMKVGLFFIISDVFDYQLLLCTASEKPPCRHC